VQGVEDLVVYVLGYQLGTVILDLPWRNCSISPTLAWINSGKSCGKSPLNSETVPISYQFGQALAKPTRDIVDLRLIRNSSPNQPPTRRSIPIILPILRIR